jgi:hypothetical protein
MECKKWKWNKYRRVGYNYKFSLAQLQLLILSDSAPNFPIRNNYVIESGSLLLSMINF